VDQFNLEDPALATSAVALRHNWLGVPPSGEVPDRRSAFGVSVFNGSNVTVEENLIQHHEGSGVITGFGRQI
jgi:hypothetical protein